jgi:hypothetical protein
MRFVPDADSIEGLVVGFCREELWKQFFFVKNLNFGMALQNLIG